MRICINVLLSHQFVVRSYSSYRKLIQSPSWDLDLVLKILESKSLDLPGLYPKIFFQAPPPSSYVKCPHSHSIADGIPTTFVALASLLLEISRSYRHLILKLDPLNNNSELWHGLFVILASNMSGLYPFGTVDWLCGTSQYSSQSWLSF